MSLTISQPPGTDFGFRSIPNPHDFTSRTSFPPSRLSPTPRVDSPVTSLRASANSSESKMSTSHRGLPPPSAMALPEPNRTGPPPSLASSLGAMPAPPAQWPGQEDSMRSWLVAKAEEDKRKQEEEKTRQETLRLEQRKIEQSMLHESLRGGIPPNLIPMIYAGIGGSNLASLSMELIQQYTGQLQAAQQQVAYHPSDAPRETRLLGPGPAVYALPQQQQPPPPLPPPPQQHPHPLQQAVLPSQPMEPPQGPIQTTFSQYPTGPARAAPTSAPRSLTHSALPRLTTNEPSIHPPAPAVPGAAPPMQPTSQTAPHEQTTSSPSIYFHYWQPPNEAKPNFREISVAPSGKGSGGESSAAPTAGGAPHHTHSSSLMSESSDYRESPRKRKAQGGHHANPPPPGAAATTSPSFSTGSSGSAGGRKVGHARSRSNASTSGGPQDPDSRPGSSRLEAGDTRLPSMSSSSFFVQSRRRSDEQQQRQSPLRRSTSQPRDPIHRRLSADLAREGQQDRPASGLR